MRTTKLITVQQRVKLAYVCQLCKR